MLAFDDPFDALADGPAFRIPDDVLLGARVCDLGVSLEDTGYEKYAMRLQSELRRRGLGAVSPKFFLGDEWFCPEGSMEIGIPFWLASPQLRRIERQHMGEVEGGISREFMQLLRHEMGHCVDHAFRLSRRKDWQMVFGSPKIPYQPDSYRVDEESQDFVQYLPGYYAQSHPEEDFAETFAVWLDPRSNWQSTYRSWQIALKKLKFVDHLMTLVAGMEPYPPRTSRVGRAERLRVPLAEFYRRRKQTQVLLGRHFRDTNLVQNAHNPTT